jgi:hypothetical protein
MSKIVEFVIKNVPHLLLIVVLISAQLLFFNSNIIGIYLFGILYTSENRYKLFISSLFTTLIYDSVKIIILGSWALSFFLVAICGEVIIKIVGSPRDRTTESMRSYLILFIVISASALAQNYLLQLFAQQAVAQQNQFSIVVCVLLYLLLRKIMSNRKSGDYLQI